MEFLYTRQQMEGYKGYNARVKIGNWSEDMELEAARLKNFLLKKDRGELKSTQAEQRFAHALQPVELKPKTNDGYVHFGDIMMLFNQATDGCLACDPQESLSDESFATTSTWYTEPCARNTFEIKRWEGRGDKKDAMFDFQDDIVHFGQKVQIKCNPLITGGESAFLTSYPKTPTSYSRYTRNQEVAMSLNGGWSSVWEIQYLDPQFKMEMEGQAVPTNAPLAILHCATHQHLASNVVKYRNDFGTEYEMFCKTFNDIMKGQLGTRERTMLDECNRWCFVSSIPSEEDAIAQEQEAEDGRQEEDENAAGN
uniref:Uncharacterized protein n=2 Tax=Hanusia phi TaxID=3032 RepID=A0A7S0ERT5_9CRYP|mmetsp:Transcript_30521/g.68932  ORF Transcript_30521/g.68932 Transcript_30521/m.68932 type:complete len:310 (+) Transcript_30521:252-1181(+)|eukprot:765456-Hanusia_phi.AAC.3